MLRIGNRIKLTPKELDDFKDNTGAQTAPTTVEEYNLKIRNTIAYWMDLYLRENCAEAGLLVAFYERFLIE